MRAATHAADLTSPRDAHHGAYCSERCAHAAVAAPETPVIVSAPTHEITTEPAARRKVRGATSWQAWLRERSQDRDRALPDSSGRRRESVDRSETDSMTGGTITSTDDSSVIGGADDDSDGVNVFASRRPPAEAVAPKPINGATPPRPPHLSAFASRTVPNVRSPGLRRRDVYDPTPAPAPATFYPHAHPASNAATTSEGRLVGPSGRTRSSRKLFMASGRDRFFDDDSDPEPTMAERERTARAFIEHAAQSSMQLFRRARHRQRAPSRHSSSSDRGAPSPDPPATVKPTPTKARKSTSFFFASNGSDADSDGEVEHIEDTAAHQPHQSRSAASAASAWSRPLATMRRISSGQRTPTGPASTSNGLSVWSMAELSLDNDSTPSPTSEQPASVKAVPPSLTMTRGRSGGAAAAAADDDERRGRSRRPRSVSLSQKAPSLTGAVGQ